MIHKILANLFTKNQFSKITQQQNEALLDVIALSMAADGLLEPQERVEALAALKQLNWKDHSSAELYFDGSCEKAPGLLADPDVLDTYLSELSERLGEQWLVEEAYYIAARVAAVDSDVAHEERELLSALVRHFNIPSDRLRTITDLIMREFSI